MENLPGAVPARGAIGAPQVLVHDRGGNAGLAAHVGGRFIVVGRCDADGGVFAVPHDGGAVRAADLSVELGDRSAEIPPAMLPPGSPPQGEMPTHNHVVVDMALSRGGNEVAATAGCGVRVVTVDPLTGEMHRRSVLSGGTDATIRVAVSSDGGLILGADAGGNVRVWESSGKALHTLRISRPPTTAAFVWNDMLAAVGDDTGRIVAWELGAGRRHLQFQAHRSAVSRMAFNAERALLVTAGADFAVRVWHLEQGERVGRDRMHRGNVHDVCFARGGRYVVSSSADGHIAIWSASDGALLDWVFEGSPVFRITVDETTGALISAGPRAIRSYPVDWDRIAALDRGAAAAAVPPAPAAFVQPPSRPPVSHGGAGGTDAPVGATFAPRATADLPMPDRSNLPVQRGRSAAPATMAMSAVGRAAIEGGVPVRERFGGRPAAAPDLASPPAMLRPSASTGALPAITGPAAPAPSVEGMTEDEEQAFDDFFASAFTGAASSEEASAPAPAPAMTHTPPPAAGLAPAPAPRAEAAADRRAAPSKAARTAPPLPIASGLVLVVGLVLAIVARLGLEFWYTERAWPEQVRERGEAIERDHAERMEALEFEHATFVQEREQEIAGHAANGSLSASERERLRQRIERRVEERAAEVQAEHAALEAAREASLGEIAEERRRTAVETANLGAGLLFVLALLGAFGLAVRARRRSSS